MLSRVSATTPGAADHDDIASPKTVRIIQLSPEAIAALARADLDAARRLSGLHLTDYLVSSDCLGTWRIRADQVAVDPDVAGWVTGVIWADDLDAAVGKAGFHGPPDDRGMVEVGYSVDPEYRRQGYARAALVELLTRAAREPGVSRVRVSIRPDNIASRDLVLPYGFAAVGEQLDDVDGLEIIYERLVAL
jgi:RimJ/RimL family protein N-acetyltransferase